MIMLWSSFLHLGYIDDIFLVQSSALTLESSWISLLISFDTYFCNGLTFIGRLLFRCDIPHTAHWYAFGISENTYMYTFKHSHIKHQINPCMSLTWYIHNQTTFQSFAMLTFTRGIGIKLLCDTTLPTRGYCLNYHEPDTPCRSMLSSLIY